MKKNKNDNINKEDDENDYDLYSEDESNDFLSSNSHPLEIITYKDINPTFLFWWRINKKTSKYKNAFDNFKNILICLSFYYLLLSSIEWLYHPTEGAVALGLSLFCDLLLFAYMLITLFFYELLFNNVYSSWDDNGQLKILLTDDAAVFIFETLKRLAKTKAYRKIKRIAPIKDLD